GIGNVTDINLTLFQLLWKLDFEVLPVVLRTRDEGIMSTTIPSLNKLNYVIVQVKMNNQTYLLDATDELLPYGFLPERCINGQGRTVCDYPEWVELKTSKKDKETISYDLDLKNESLSLKGKIIHKKNDYAAFNFRKKYRTFNSKEEYLDEFQKDKAGLKILSSEILKLDSIYFPVQEKYEVSVTNRVSEIEGELYINPLLYSQFKENPFKSDEREYPVDFPYLIEKSFIVTIKIPERYTIASLPESVKLQLPNNAASFVYQIAFVNNTIQLNCKFNINKEIFPVEEYSDLKEFYAQVIKQQALPVILKKN
ncbi:MAG TPA: DUF3858 domain-containing protein, partial [Bacteroidia bacterium]|nr:DUF3858 domain-containing protein [Bacteroidia bacterium]